MILTEKEWAVLAKKKAFVIKVYFILKKLSRGKNEFFLNGYAPLLTLCASDVRGDDIKSVRKELKNSIKILKNLSLISSEKFPGKRILVKIHFFDLQNIGEKNRPKTMQNTGENTPLGSHVDHTRITRGSHVDHTRITHEMSKPIPGKGAEPVDNSSWITRGSHVDHTRITRGSHTDHCEVIFEKQPNSPKISNENQLLYSTGTRARSMPLKSFKSLKAKEKEKKKEKYIKEKVKEKENHESPEFQKFWSAYPRKEGRAKAWRLWQEESLHEHATEIMADLAVRIFPPQLAYTIAPLTYLTNQVWKDDFKGEHVKTKEDIEAEREAKRKAEFEQAEQRMRQITQLEKEIEQRQLEEIRGRFSKTLPPLLDPRDFKG